MTHICVGNLTIIGPDNGLSPSRRQAITWTNAGKLLIGPLGTSFSSSKKMRLKVSSAIWHPSCLGLNVLTCPFVIRTRISVSNIVMMEESGSCEGPLTITKQNYTNHLMLSISSEVRYISNSIKYQWYFAAKQPEWRAAFYKANFLTLQSVLYTLHISVSRYVSSNVCPVVIQLAEDRLYM